MRKPALSFASLLLVSCVESASSTTEPIRIDGGSARDAWTRDAATCETTAPRMCGRPMSACTATCDPATVWPTHACTTDALGSCWVQLDAGDPPCDGSCGGSDAGIDAAAYGCDGGTVMRECFTPWEPCAAPCDPRRIPFASWCATDELGSCWQGLDGGAVPFPECDGGLHYTRACGHGLEACSHPCDPSSPPAGGICSTDRFGDCAVYPEDCDGGTGFVRECGRGPRDCAIDCEPAIIHPSLTCGMDEHGSCFIDAVDAG
jgi:hypothetical protein